MDAVNLFLLAVKGLLVASVPLAMVWAARGPDKLRRLAWITVFFTFDLIVFGAFTRLTDSGLGCPDWPGCYAKANPIAALADIRAAEAAMPGGPVTVFKAWIEMLHRYLAMGVGLLIIAMMVLAWRRAWQRGGARPWLATALFGLVCLQGAFGAWTVTLKLQPAIVTMHLMLGMLLLALLTLQAARLDTVFSASSAALPAAPTASADGLTPPAWRALRLLAAFGLFLLALQIALGGWVSTNYAVLACADFPSCQGSLVPEMDFRNGFDPWRELGRTSARGSDGAAGYLPFAALTAIHWVHRNFAFVVFAVLGLLAWKSARVPVLRPLTRGLGILLLAQFVTGIANIVFDWPLVAAVLHNAGAAALVLVLVMLNYRTAQLTPPASRPVSLARS